MRDLLTNLASLSDNRLTCDALDIWRAGVQAVRPACLMKRKVRVDFQRFVIDDRCEIDLASTRRLIIVGAGKASAAMAEAFCNSVKAAGLGRAAPEIVGWINAPEGSISGQIAGVHLFAARPAGSNLPTREAQQGTQRILSLVSEARPDDIVVCLLSGGGSSLLVAPQPGISLEDKQNVARWIAAAGGDIHQLNTVRRCLSQIKGGGLARACRARRLICLIISDVLGDSLDMIASGPTCLHPSTAPGEALSVLKDLDLLSVPELQGVIQWLRSPRLSPHSEDRSTEVENIILGNNSDAVDAAGVKAVALGYRYWMQSARRLEGDVELVAEQCYQAIEAMKEDGITNCWISGGEPTVRLPRQGAGQGGRNQHLALGVLNKLMQKNWPEGWQNWQLAFLSGGTDGEDGPTDAAGAFLDRTIYDRFQKSGCNPHDFLRRADSYHFFDPVGGLIRCGPTGTNVCDLRVALCVPAR